MAKIFNEKEQNEKRNEYITRAEEIMKTAKTENRELTEAEAAELAEIRDNVRKIIEAMQFDDDFAKMEKMAEKKDNTPTEEEEEVTVTTEEKAREIEAQEKRAFENYIRGFVVHERAGELTPASGSGGKLIPTTIVNYIIKKVYDIVIKAGTHLVS